MPSGASHPYRRSRTWRHNLSFTGTIFPASVIWLGITVLGATVRPLSTEPTVAAIPMQPTLFLCHLNRYGTLSPHVTRTSYPPGIHKNLIRVRALRSRTYTRSVTRSCAGISDVDHISSERPVQALSITKVPLMRIA
jgi:hypothetical protein